MHVHRVLELLLQNYLYIKLEQSQFHITMISFFGLVVHGGPEHGPSQGKGCLKLVIQYSTF